MNRERLDEATEGWAAGLRLAGPTMSNMQASDHVALDLAGADNPIVTNHPIEEVLVPTIISGARVSPGNIHSRTIQL